MRPPSRPRSSRPVSAWQCAAVVALVVTLAGCASRIRAPVEDRSATPPHQGWPAPVGSAASGPATAPATAEADTRPATYTVKRGDTLYQIALDTGFDYRELAAWNNIENVNLIRVGQVLRLTAPGDAAPVAGGATTAPLKPAPAVVETRPGAPAASPAAAVARNTDNYKSSPKALKEPYSEQAVRDVTRLAALPPEPVAPPPPVAAPAPAPPKADPPRVAGNDSDDDDKLEWVWPTKGKVVGSFSETANLKGIDISGAVGQPVLASAAGTVVYAGTGLRGYGKLIIVKHNRSYLSAYAHNRDILVKEGQTVTRGQKIAEMGNTDATEVKLHFEIRRLGKPMDPARYLPPA